VFLAWWISDRGGGEALGLWDIEFEVEN